MAHTDYFLKIDSIKGESHDSKHKDEIEVRSWSWGETQTGTNAFGGGGGGGKVNMRDFMFTMRTNVGSPHLMLACAQGTHISEAVLTCRKAGGSAGPQEYLVYTFKDVIISSFNVGAPIDPNDALPLETITFNFAQIQMEYKQQDSKGRTIPGPKTGYDLKGNKSI